MADGFGLPAAAAVAEVLIDMIKNFRPVKLSADELEGSRTAWVAGGGDDVVEFKNFQVEGGMVRYVEGPPKSLAVLGPWCIPLDLSSWIVACLGPARLRLL